MEPQEENTNNNDKSKRKKTRDLPNLTECHSCGYRIDSCNYNGSNSSSNNNNINTSNNRLHTLYSEWRIVLLCKHCFFSVESSHLCSYCFKASSSSSGNCFHCRQCNRIIHNSCFSKYSKIAPWSFSSQFSLCVDCWVPKSVASKRLRSRSKKRNHNNSNNNNASKCSLLENVVRDANCDVQKKVEAAARARELAVEKALAARKAAGLACKALNLVADTSAEDVQLALRLHRALNSSPRILKNFCSVSSAGLNPSVRGGVCRELDVSHAEIAADNSVSVRVSGYDSLGSVGIDGGSPLTADERYNRKHDRYSIKYSRRTSANDRYNRKPDLFLRKYSRRTSLDERYNRSPDLYLRKYSRRTSDCERFDGKLDRYSIKYSRRRVPADEEYSEKRDPYSIKYSRRRLTQQSILDYSSKSLYERLNGEAQAFSVGVVLGCQGSQ